MCIGEYHDDTEGPVEDVGIVVSKDGRRRAGVCWRHADPEARTGLWTRDRDFRGGAFYPYQWRSVTVLGPESPRTQLTFNIACRYKCGMTSGDTDIYLVCRGGVVSGFCIECYGRHLHDQRQAGRDKDVLTKRKRAKGRKS